MIGALRTTAVSPAEPRQDKVIGVRQSTDDLQIAKLLKTVFPEQGTLANRLR